MKIHCVLLKIQNSSGIEMTYKSDWYHRGRLADGFEWPGTIGGNDHTEVLNYERDLSLAGCSGYVTYIIGSAEVTIAFSNPVVDYSTLGVGTNGHQVWDNKF